MTIQQLFEITNSNVQRLGKLPVVVLPLKIWEEIEDSLEDLQIARSRFLKKKIARACLEKKLYPASQVKKLIGTN